MDPVEYINATKSLIFTVTAGRSGTKYLARLLGAVPGVSAHHDGDPSFASVFRRSQQNADLAYTFLREVKLPAIAAVSPMVYAETSHLFCKGFLEPMILMGLRPGLVILRRDPTEVAWSLLESNAVPARTAAGLLTLLDPRDPYVVPLPGWEAMSDYQLCFWYALEMERRQIRYAGYAQSLEMPVHRASLHDLHDAEKFCSLLATFGLVASDETMEQHAIISRVRHNENVHRLERSPRLSDEEVEVWHKVLRHEPLLGNAVAKEIKSAA